MNNDFDFVKEVLSCCKRKERKYKTIILQDSETKLYKIAKAEDIEKRFKVLHSTNPNLSIKAIINDNVKSEILKGLGILATGSDWIKLSDDEINNIIKQYANL